MSERTTAGPRPTEPGQATQDATVRPFQVSVPDEGLVELRRRLAAARWPSKELVRDQLQGVQLATLQALTRYWATDYDLRRIEARLNALPGGAEEPRPRPDHRRGWRQVADTALPFVQPFTCPPACLAVRPG